MRTGCAAPWPTSAEEDAIGPALLLLLALALFAPASARATDFFVDAHAGSDHASGTRESPWKSLWRVSRARLAPGDRVLFRSGQVFRGQLRLDVSGAPGRPIVFASFGEGPPPSLRGTVERASPADWTETGDGVWYLANLSRDPQLLLADGRPGRRMAGRAELARDWDHSYDGQRGRLLVKAAQNPALLTRMVETGEHDFVLGPVAGSHLAFDGLEFAGSRGSTVLVWGGGDISFTGCSFTLAPVNHLQLHHGAGRVLVRGCRFDDWNLGRDAAYAVQAIADSGPVDVEDCLFTATLPGGGRDHTAIMSDLGGWVRRVRGCRFEGGQGRLADDGVVVWRLAQRADQVEVADNVFTELGGVAVILQETGHFGARPALRVADNRILGAVLGGDLDKEAVRVRDTAGAAVTVEGNLVADTGAAAAGNGFEHDGITADNAPGALIRANTVRGAHNGLRIGGGTPDARVVGNRLVSNRGHGLRVMPGAATAEQQDNCLWDNAEGPVKGSPLGPGDAPWPQASAPCAAAP